MCVCVCGGGGGGERRDDTSEHVRQYLHRPRVYMRVWARARMRVTRVYLQ